MIDLSIPSTRIVFISALVILLVAAIPRFYLLGDAGFLGDEETSSFPSRRLLNGQGSTMPSGLEYRRALPQTWVSAVVASYLGETEEISYRVYSALTGALTPFLIILLGTRLFGFPVAVLSALCVGVSDWHIFVSREARMYAPFLLFYLGSALCLWRWATDRQWGYIAGGLILALVAAMHHALALFLVMFPMITLLRSPEKTKLWIPGIVVSLFIAFATWAWIAYVQAPYASVARVDQIEAESITGSELGGVYITVGVLGALGSAIAGLWAYHLRVPTATWEANLRNIVLAMATGLAIGTANFGAAFFAGLLAFLFHPPFVWQKQIRYFVLLGMVGTVAAALVLLAHDWNIVESLRAMAILPKPFLLTMYGVESPLIVALYLGALWVVLHPRCSESNIRIAFVSALVPILTIGFIQSDVPSRYLIVTFPFLIFTAMGTLAILSKLFCSFLWRYRIRVAPLVIGVLVVLSGALSTYGIVPAFAVAVVNHVPITNLGKLRSDHRGAGEFVRARLNSADTVIAEDALQQRWYVGRADVWLRSPNKMFQFLAMNREGEDFNRDIYVDSIIPNDLRHLRRIIDETRGNAWLITSGETYGQWEWYLDGEVNGWLMEVLATSTPYYVGEDGITKVFCVNCADDSATVPF